MRSKSFDGMACSIAGALEAIGYRWAVLILRDLSLGLSRYEELRRSTGVTNATLSDRLKHLEDNELIERRRYQVWLRSRARADPFHCRRAGQIARRTKSHFVEPGTPPWQQTSDPVVIVSAARHALCVPKT
jgi:hypothetical protein